MNRIGWWFLYLYVYYERKTKIDEGIRKGEGLSNYLSTHPASNTLNRKDMLKLRTPRRQNIEGPSQPGYLGASDPGQTVVQECTRP